MKTRKNNNKNNVSNNNNSSIDINAINATKYNCNMFESNEVNDSVVTIDNSRINQVDVMKMSRIDFFRKLVLANVTFNTLAIYDYRFYNNTNDRSKSRKQDKQEDLLSYSRMRTRKQLADVLKEKNIVAFLCNKYNVKTYLTVNQYIDTVK
jgi:hypothetical protein